MSNPVTDTIAKQIGSRAFLMMGAKNILAGEDYLMFSIMRNAKGVSKIVVGYDAGSDTYNVTFVGRGQSMIADVDGVYFDQLRSVIESNTGLYLSL